MYLIFAFNQYYPHGGLYFNGKLLGGEIDMQARMKEDSECK